MRIMHAQPQGKHICEDGDEMRHTYCCSSRHSSACESYQHRSWYSTTSVPMRAHIPWKSERKGGQTITYLIKHCIPNLAVARIYHVSTDVRRARINRSSPAFNDGDHFGRR